MTRRVVVLLVTDHDLDEQAAYYLQRASPATAARWYDQTAASFDFLARQPKIGQLRTTHDPALHGIPMWSVSGFERHLVFYRPLPDGIEVLVTSRNGFASTSPVGRRGIPPRAVAVQRRRVGRRQPKLP